MYYDVGPFGNAWQVLKHEDALFVLRQAELFSNEDATPFPRDPEDCFYFIPIEIDPPDHRNRNIVDPVISPQGVLKLEDRIRALANELIDGFIEQGECEIGAVLPKGGAVSGYIDEDVQQSFAEASATPMQVQVLAAQPFAVADTLPAN